MTKEKINFQKSDLETIDTGLYEWTKSLGLITKTNKGLYDVPVLWLGTERVWQIKNDQRIRDKVGKLVLPLVTINRDSVTKDPTFKGSFQANLRENKDYKGGAIGAGDTINQDKTQNFQNTRAVKQTNNRQSNAKLDPNEEIIRNTYASPIPVYVNITYSITLRTEYQQQMNDLLQPFVTVTGQINSFVFEKDGHRYEAFIQQDFTTNNNTTNIGEDERMFETKIQIKVLGYFVGEGFSRNKPLLARRENQVRIRFGSERSVVGDKIPWKNKDNDYKE